MEMYEVQAIETQLNAPEVVEGRTVSGATGDHGGQAEAPRHATGAQVGKCPPEPQGGGSQRGAHVDEVRQVRDGQESTLPTVSGAY